MALLGVVVRGGIIFLIPVLAVLSGGVFFLCNVLCHAKFTPIFVWFIFIYVLYFLIFIYVLCLFFSLTYRYVLSPRALSRFSLRCMCVILHFACL